MASETLALELQSLSEELKPAEAQRLLEDEAFRKVVQRVRIFQYRRIENARHDDLDTLGDASRMLKSLSQIEHVLRFAANRAKLQAKDEHGHRVRRAAIV